MPTVVPSSFLLLLVRHFNKTTFCSTHLEEVWVFTRMKTHGRCISRWKMLLQFIRPILFLRFVFCLFFLASYFVFFDFSSLLGSSVFWSVTFSFFFSYISSLSPSVSVCLSFICFLFLCTRPSSSERCFVQKRWLPRDSSGSSNS